MIDRQKKEEQFEWWITCIPDKIITLKNLIPVEYSEKLDFSIQSIDLLEHFILENYSFERLEKQKEHWDAFASYLGQAYKTLIPKSKWYIELEDIENVFYNKPCLRVDNKLNFVPHSYISAAIDRKKGNFISTIINNHIKQISEM